MTHEQKKEHLDNLQAIIAREKEVLGKAMAHYENKLADMMERVATVLDAPITPQRLQDVYRKVRPSFYIQRNGFLGQTTVSEIYSGEVLFDCVPSENAAWQLRAIANMMSVAQYVNEGWKPDWSGSGNLKYGFTLQHGNLQYIATWAVNDGRPLFKSEEAARLAVTIMGPENMNHYFGIFND